MSQMDEIEKVEANAEGHAQFPPAAQALLSIGFDTQK